MATAIVRAARLSFVWAESAAQELDVKIAAGPLAFVRNKAAYADSYEKLRRGALDNGNAVSVPWLGDTGNRFWRYYLVAQQLEQVKPSDVWKGLVPARDTLGWEVKTGKWLSGRVGIESFYGTHGRAIVVTLNVSGTIQLADFVQVAYQARNNGEYQISQSGKAVFAGVLGDVATRALATARERLLGTAANPGSYSFTPFSVVTFIQLEGVDPTKAIDEGGEIHSALEALTTWNQAYPAIQARPIAKAAINVGLASSSALYAAPRGRAVWVPVKAQDPNSDFLSCYHRVLVFLVTQVESLGTFVQDAAPTVDVAKTPEQWAVARLAAGCLGRLFGGQSTFRSQSTPRHVEDNGWVNPLDQLREKFHWPAVVR